MEKAIFGFDGQRNVETDEVMMMGKVIPEVRGYYMFCF